MVSKEKYLEFCNASGVYVPVFSQPWWMDAACGKENWNVYVVEKGGGVVAAMPYYLENRGGELVITKAKNTQNNGILIRYPENQKYISRLDYEEKIIEEVIGFIEGLGLARYEQQYHYSFENWLPFFWNGYGETTRYTYVIEDTRDMERVEADFSTDARKALRKARRIVRLNEEELTADAFYEINRMSFARQGKEIPYSLEFVQEIYRAAKEHDAVKILSAVDGENRIHSVAFIVWDSRSVYYLLNGSDPRFRASQANTFLIYEAIKMAHELGKKFDFEGSVIRPIERAFREYGGIRKPYFRITKTFGVKEA